MLMLDDSMRKIQNARTPQQLADEIKPLLTHPPGPFEGKKLLELARHTAEVEIRPCYSSMPLVPKNCNLKQLYEWCNLKKEERV
jgi:hypothetical protein